ncbi:hypothetical protein [Ruegeria sp. SCP11]|uniref:hypothetical protein n=1 Tax=Ruegeria sp. SCP11 TaxID=3141378 RepID=UPI0033381CF6
MRAGKSGRVAIKWGQTEIDGLEAAPQSFLRVGAAWSWRGQVRFLIESREQALERAGSPLESTTLTLGHEELDQIYPDAASGVLVLTNGAQTFTASLLQVSGEFAPVLVFEGDCPARDQEFWVSEYTETDSKSGEVAGMGDTVVAFPPRTQLELGDQGQRRVVSAGRRTD